MLCVIAKLSDTAARELDMVKEKVFNTIGLKPLYGHITIATYIGKDEPGFIRSCREMVEGISSFTVEYEKIEVLEETSIIVASPKKSGLLESIHQNIAETFNDALDKWTGIGVWYPHTTLFYGPGENLYEISRRMSDTFTPFSARVTAIEFSRVLESGYDVIDHIELLD